MATVISSTNIQKHNVNKYNFKVIAFGGTEEKKESPPTQEAAPQPKVTQEQTTEIDSSALNSKSKESLIESLMKKTDEMSSNFIKLQMKLEAKEAAFAEGMQAGKAEALEEIDKNLNSKMELFTNSIAKLDKSAGEFATSLESLKGELIHAALDIAKEVIKVELSINSSEVAKVLAEELINDLQGASKVTLKVNPKNHAYISEHLGNLAYVTVVADSAISEGGVVVLSDVGNIDAQIEKRFERVKRAALSE